MQQAFIERLLCTRPHRLPVRLENDWLSSIPVHPHPPTPVTQACADKIPLPHLGGRVALPSPAAAVGPSDHMAARKLPWT